MTKELASPVIVSSKLLKSAENPIDLLHRFNLYGQALAKASDGKSSFLTILTSFPEVIANSFEIADYPWLRIHNTKTRSWNFVGFAIRSLLFLRKSHIRPIILVAADLYFSFLATSLLRAFVRKEVRIQVSVHGRLDNPTDLKFFSILRKLYLAEVFRKSDSIRCVSVHSLAELEKSFGVLKNRTFISPIPLRELELIVQTEKKKVVAFLGRMHHERGVFEWVSIIRNLCLIRQDFSILLIGDGPLRYDVEKKLSTIDSQIELTSVGRVSSLEVEKLLSGVKVLLSTAPSEGYGMALREALIHGVYVCAKHSEGSRILENEWPQLVQTFRSGLEAPEKISQMLDDEFPIEEINKIRSAFSVSNQKSLQILVASWLEPI